MVPEIHSHDIQSLADAARAALPADIQAAARDLIVQIADWPTGDVLDELGINDPLELTGLYEGLPLTQKSFLDQPAGPDIVWLFREPILAEWRDRGDVELGDLVAHILVHEFAHHFGWSDEDIAAIDRWWE